MSTSPSSESSSNSPSHHNNRNSSPSSASSEPRKSSNAAVKPAPQPSTIPSLLSLTHSHILSQTPYQNLPISLRTQYSQSDYIQESLTYHVLHRATPYDNISRELKSLYSRDQYYNQLIKMMQKNLQIFPYQFSSLLHNTLKLTPYQYYFQMLVSMMKQECSYDTLPNFTAADVHRLLGIGRNQYIDMMNSARSKKWSWRFRSKNMAKDLLPSAPQVEKMDIQYWWIVEPCTSIAPDQFAKIYVTLSEQEQIVIGQVKSEGRILACRLNLNALKSLYKRGFLYFSVPVQDEDYLLIPPLKNFIMNRQPNNDFEKLLYDILVTLDEKTTVGELSRILERDANMVRAAVSLCCRLGFAKKKLQRPRNLKDSLQDQYLNEWEDLIQQYHTDIDKHSLTDTVSKLEPESAETETSSPAAAGTMSPVSAKAEKKLKRIVFLFDSTLTAYLMMGNLGAGLKSHAVTLFEVGKMPDETLNQFLEELDKVSLNEEDEGEAQRYYKHAIALRNTLRFLRHNSAFSDIPGTDGGLDIIRCESLNQLDPGTKMRVLQSNYAVEIAMAPLTARSLELPTVNYRVYGPPHTQVSSPWFKLFLYHCAGVGPRSKLLCKGQRLTKLPRLLRGAERYSVTSWTSEPNIVQNNIALQVVNENLIHSPVLFQVYQQTLDTQVESFDVVFPFKEKSQEDIDQMQPQEREEYQQVKTIMQKLSEKLYLESSFGIVTLMRVSEGEDEESDTSPSSTVMPIGMSFGIPLADTTLNKQVCETIEKEKLFSEENREKHRQNMHKMCQEFLIFIDEHIRVQMRLMQEIYPTNPLDFDGEKVVMGSF